MTAALTHVPSPACIALIAQFESCARKLKNGSYHAYPDPNTKAAPWTIGYGHTGHDVQPNTIWPKAQCETALAADIARFAAYIRPYLTAPTTQHQFDALVSFAFNAGPGTEHHSHILKLHNLGQHEQCACAWLTQNIDAGGPAEGGLRRRRAAEAALYSRKDT